MQTQSLQGGFADPARDSARAFRAAMQAMARPGRIHPISGATPPAPLSTALGTLLLTLCDADTPLHLTAAFDTPPIRDWIRFHVAAPLVGREQAAFAVGTWPDLLPLADYAIGTPDYPDRSVTFLVAVETLETSGSVLRGPGIAATQRFNLPDSALIDFNVARFPLGIDAFFTAQAHIAAIPRTTRLASKEPA